MDEAAGVRGTARPVGPGAPSSPPDGPPDGPDDFIADSTAGSTGDGEPNGAPVRPASEPGDHEPVDHEPVDYEVAPTSAERRHVRRRRGGQAATGDAVPRQSAWRAVGGVGAVCLVLGALLGVAWRLLAPDVQLIAFDGSLRIDNRAGQAMFSVDAVFGLLAAGAGMLAAVLTWWRYASSRPVAAMLTLAVFGVLGSLLALLVGRWLGPPEPTSATGLADGSLVSAPLALHALGVLLLWPFTSLLLVFVSAVMEPSGQPAGAEEAQRQLDD